MRLFIALLLAGSAFAQVSLIGLNSSAAKVSAGSRDTAVPIKLDPSPEGGDLFTIMLMSEDIQIRMELPDGRFVTKENASSLGFTWESMGEVKGAAVLIPGLQGKMNHLLVLPPSAPAGNYKIHADAGNLEEDSVVVVGFFPLGGPQGGPPGQRNSVEVAIGTPEMFHYAGDKVQLAAGVFEGNRGVNDATLSATAVAVNESRIAIGQPVPVTFQPSGPGADGSYTAEFPATAVGTYDVHLKVTGKHADGTDFERITGTSIKIEPRRAKLLAATERPVDDDGNGLTDQIEVTARVKVELAGDYLLTVNLEAPGGHMQAYGKATLGVGEGTITATVDRYNLTHVEADGPYAIHLGLSRQEGDVPQFASMLNNAGMTRAYKRSSFDRGAMYFVGTAQATPQSANGKAPFDKLLVSLDVFTPGGTCGWFSGRLTSGNAALSQYENSDGELPKGAGKVILTFDGPTISDELDGKSLSIHDTTLNCGSLAITLEHPIALGEFPAGTFVNPGPSFDFDDKWGTTDPLGAKRGEAREFVFGIRTYGGFKGTVEMAVDGLPSGFEVQELEPNVRGRDGHSFHVTAAQSVTPGPYEFTLRAKSGTLERTRKLTIVVIP